LPKDAARTGTVTRRCTDLREVIAADEARVADAGYGISTKSKATGAAQLAVRPLRLERARRSRETPAVDGWVGMKPRR